MFFFFFFKQKTAYEMRISDWSSDVCSSDLPTSLQLAAETSGVPAFLFRRASKLGPAVEGSAALTRWRITASPSEDLGIPSLGRPRWRVDLERVRGGTPHQWLLEGCDATGRIALPAALVDRPAAQEDRQAAA